MQLQWDLFCRVVDNFGDVGVCWRLAADLAERGERVRLWVDDATALAWMAPCGAPGVQVRAWLADPAVQPKADVVVEAFGCDPPAAFVQQMARQQPPPVWINLEYLSAEAAVGRLHELPSPQLSGPGRGLTKWFFYPGFTVESGGLIREAALLEARRSFDADAWLQGQGVRQDLLSQEGRISLFCYDNPGLVALLEALAATPHLLLVPRGPAAQQVRQALGPALARGALRAVLLPWLTQPDFDRLLWSCDLNFVRGEDSFVRAQWAGAPFVWQIYPQPDGAHEAKLDAFLDLYLADTAAPWSAGVRRLWHAWNGLRGEPPCFADAACPAAQWHAHGLAWREHLWTQPPLSQRLLRFVAERR